MCLPKAGMSFTMSGIAPPYKNSAELRVNCKGHDKRSSRLARLFRGAIYSGADQRLAYCNRLTSAQKLPKQVDQNIHDPKAGMSSKINNILQKWGLDRKP
jgi:hypothetical protein